MILAPITLEELQARHARKQTSPGSLSNRLQSARIRNSGYPSIEDSTGMFPLREVLPWVSCSWACSVPIRSGYCAIHGWMTDADAEASWAIR